ncbi:MAG: phosphoribosylamine--glycine ligase [Nitrospinae bacterium]|nr:phosphoribosylamine--glycine ligase [Nitrospinota bacterium]
MTNKALNILILGSGGREHALAWKIAQSPLVSKIYCAPGNPGTESCAQNIPIAADDVPALLKFAKENNIHLTVPGPEAPLVRGVVNTFIAEGLLIAGPTKEAAMLEGSKIFMKEIVAKSGAPTARYEVHTDRDEAIAALEKFGERVVIKADGLAAGKGVVVASSRDEAVEAIDSMLVERVFGDAGAKIILEETLDGEEASILAFCDGERVIMIPSCQDHKRVGDDDTGPNTGGMGAYSPAPVITPQLEKWIEENVMIKVLRTMAESGVPYKGILYGGLMITKDGPKVLEFNCRFGDPECQPIMARMDSDIVPVLMAMAKGDLRGVEVRWSPKAAVCVVMAAGGYPGSYEKGKVIQGLEAAGDIPGIVVFQAGTSRNASGEVVTSGGRVLGITATGGTVKDAIDTAYNGVGQINFPGAHYRKDIGRRAIIR